jgi:hypothetical protein
MFRIVLERSICLFKDGIQLFESRSYIVWSFTWHFTIVLSSMRLSIFFSIYWEHSQWIERTHKFFWSYHLFECAHKIFDN